MSLSKEKEILLNILGYLKDMPFIWNKTHEQYFNKHMRNEGFRKLLEMYKQLDDHATIKTLKKKLDNMRTNYYRELSKVKASIEPGLELYVPSLWYFEAYSFLHADTELPARSLTHVSAIDLSSTEEETSQSESTESRTWKKPPKKKMKSMQQAAETMMPKREEDAEITGRAIGVQLRDLKHAQLTIARKLISDVIYYASLDKLTEHSKVLVHHDYVDFFSPAAERRYSRPSPSPDPIRFHVKQASSSP